jgi:hypothetical protein
MRIDDAVFMNITSKPISSKLLYIETNIIMSIFNYFYYEKVTSFSIILAKYIKCIFFIGMSFKCYYNITSIVVSLTFLVIRVFLENGLGSFQAFLILKI